MTAMLESQIALKLLTKSILFSSSKRISKVIKKANIIEIKKVIYNIRNYCKIKITEDNIDKKTISKWFYMEDKESSTKEKTKII